MILPAVNVNGIHLSSQQHEALVSIWRTGRMPEAQTGQKPWLWIQALRRRGLVSGNALRLTDKGRHIVQLLQDRKAFRLKAPPTIHTTELTGTPTTPTSPHTRTSRRWKSFAKGTVMKLDPPPDLVEIAEALDAMAKPHVGSGWANTNYTDLPCTTPRQEAIWMAYNGITRGED